MLCKGQVFYKNKLPIAYTPEGYGNILVKNKDNTFYILAYNKAQIIIEVSKQNDDIISVVKYMKNNKVIFEWVDTIINNNYLLRSIGSSIYHFLEGESEGP